MNKLATHQKYAEIDEMKSLTDKSRMIKTVYESINDGKVHTESDQTPRNNSKSQASKRGH